MEFLPENTISAADLYITHYIKKYPDRLKLIQYKTPYKNKDEKNENKKLRIINSKLLTEEEKLEKIDESLRRTKTTITDLVLCNQFDLFVTFTFNCRACIPKCTNDPCSCDIAICTRYDLDYVIRTQKTWYNNIIKRYGKFTYLQVMELHKKGGYHFHALFRDFKGKLKIHGIDKKDRRQIYTIASNRKGFTTAKKIYDISGTSSYIRKYITKDMPVYLNKKRFWHSQGLKKPVIVQDPQLMAEILANPAKEVWIPDETPTIREDGTFKINATNLESITTLLIDNKSSYEKEYLLWRSLDKLTQRLAAQMLPPAHPPLDRNVLAADSVSLSDDSLDILQLGLGV